jgi:glucose-6-phosphate isomerase
MSSMIAAMERRATRLDPIIDRIWKRDHTVWRDDPAEISDRLGWLTVAEEFRDRTGDLSAIAERAAADGLERVVLLGMGGSSLAAETMRRIFGVAPGAMQLDVLDSTHPAAVMRIEASGDLRKTLFLVASKSGTTLETLSHMQYFYGRIQRGDRFIVITDPGSSLHSLAESHGFRGAFLNPPEIGGRYSALSLFGLVPAAMIGADIDAILGSAIAMMQRCREQGTSNPGARLGAFLAESARAGFDKATFLLPDFLAPLGPWIEQLIAESTGKEGRGILPVVGDHAGDRFGADRVFVDYTSSSVSDAFAIEPEHLGAEFFRLEFATAVAGHLLDINPFDQPDVAAAKEATAAILDAGGPSDPGFDDPMKVLSPPPDYVGILAYVDPTPENDALIERARASLRERTGMAVTAGFGPRYLHSTGQLHKGGPDGGAFLMVVDERRSEDVVIPGRGYTFGTLIDAQSLGDLRSLRERGRRVARIRMSDLESLV